MPALRQCLKRPGFWLILLALAAAAILVDSRRPPRDQLATRGLNLGISLYQSARGLVGPRHICRFQPTCSHYAQEALSRYGLTRGMSLSLQRIGRCRSGVPFGTQDPVP